MWFAKIDKIDLLTLAWLGIYTGLCGLCYNPSLSIPATISGALGQAMLSIRACLNLDSVHFVGGSSSLENSVSIIQPIFQKLIEPQLDAGSILIKVSAMRGTYRVADWLGIMHRNDTATTLTRVSLQSPGLAKDAVKSSEPEETSTLTGTNS
jgi:hypothetical protein